MGSRKDPEKKGNRRVKRVKHPNDVFHSVPEDEIVGYDKAGRAITKKRAAQIEKLKEHCFKKGEDVRRSISTGVKTFAMLRQVAQSICDERCPITQKKRVYVLLRKLAEEDTAKFLEIAYGKPPVEVQQTQTVTSEDGTTQTQTIGRIVFFDALDNQENAIEIHGAKFVSNLPEH